MNCLAMNLYKTLAALLVSGLLQNAWAQPQAPLSTIPDLDVARYLGRWYEIAKFPNWFQKKCVSDTSADYVLLQEGQLGVLNQCRRADGEWDKAQGLARSSDGARSAKLQVRFAPAWLSFLPFAWGDYWIVDLDAAYGLVAVSEPRREYLWILSRSTQVEPERYTALLERLRAMGLDTGRLEKTPHAGP
jgi:apolipoprotein D and lipocalin family protein